MAIVTMPQLGESVAEGTIGRWLKQPGDTVAQYEPLLEVITDKVNAEVPSPFAGVLVKILAEEGATVANNAEIAIIETADDGATPAVTAPEPVTPEAAAVAVAEPLPEPATPESSTAAVSPVQAVAASAAPATASASAAATEPGPATEAAGNPDARMTPAVRRLLREHDLDAAQIVGTGGGGRITREDVLARVEGRSSMPVQSGSPAAAVSPSAAATPAPSAGQSAGPATQAAQGASVPAAAPGAARTIEFPPGADEVLLPMSKMRKGIAAQMTRALAAPHAYVQMEVDLARLVRLRDSQKAAYLAQEGISLSFVPFVVKAATEALKRNPTFNANWTDAGLVAKRRVNIGVAVAVDDGLIVPVIRDADTLSIHGLNRAIVEVAARARANRLRVDDFGGGTFTVDNTGYLGTNLVMPIINVPEVAIVTMEAITKRPVVVSGEDGDVIAIRPIMNMVLGLDHRANDGAGGAWLLRDIKAWLESVGSETSIY